jgi:hypothetical protein
MKNRIQIILLGLILTGIIVSCKSTAQTNSKVPDSYRLVVSFISKGGGISMDTHEKFEKFLKDHPKKPIVENYRWGREGEIDYCSNLKELSKKEQVAFIEEIKKIVAGSDVVLLTENTPCVHKK